MWLRSSRANIGKLAWSLYSSKCMYLKILSTVSIPTWCTLNCTVCSFWLSRFRHGDEIIKMTFIIGYCWHCLTFCTLYLKRFLQLKKLPLSWRYFYYSMSACCLIALFISVDINRERYFSFPLLYELSDELQNFIPCGAARIMSLRISYARE